MQVHHWNKVFQQTLAATGLWLAGVVLVACGGADLYSQSPGVGSGGTGGVIGTLTGLGSVFVDGVRYDDSQATLERQPDLMQSETLSLSDLQIGQYVYLESDAAGVPARVRLEAQLVGPVSSVVSTRGQLTVWGQTVVINTDPSQGPVTVFSGYASMADVTAQDLVQVYGALQSDPTSGARELIRATRIERLISTETLPARVTGTLRTNSTGGLLLAGLPLNIAQVTNLPAGQVLQSGMAVTVVLPWPQDVNLLPSRYEAVSVRMIGAMSATLNALRLSGVAQLLADGLLTVQGVQVDVSAASLAAVRAGVSDGSYITVTGNLNQKNGQLVATTLEVTPVGGRPMELRGSVVSWVNQGSFMVRGMQVNAQNARWLGGSPVDVSNGRYVEVSGSSAGNVFNASTVSLQIGLPDQAVLDVTGQVQSVDASSRQMLILTQAGQPLKVTLAPADSIPVTGATVRVEGFWKNGSLQARGLSSPPTIDSALTQIEGIVDTVTIGQFRLNGLLILVDAMHFPMLRILNGERVEVLVKFSEGRYHLVEFRVKPPLR